MSYKASGRCSVCKKPKVVSTSILEDYFRLCQEFMDSVYVCSEHKKEVEKK